MIPETLNPLTQIFLMGAVAGVVVGFAIRKLNKVIAAALGFFMLAMNASYLAMMMGFNLNLPAFDQIAETIISLSPITPEQISDQMGPYMPLFTSIPFIGGALAGVWIGFKIAG
jgi:uncharacterized membrane protein (Fun14 family)